MIANNKNECAFLELMRCGLWGTNPDISFFTGLTQSDWLDIYKIAGKQTVLGICLKPVINLPDDVKPSSDLLLQWVGLCRFVEANNRHKLQVWQELNAKFTEAGYTPVVFKGFSVAKWYTNPLSRQFSDIDIYIPERFNELIQWLKSSGISNKHMRQHDVIEYKGVTVEIHSSIINVPFKPKLKYCIVKDSISNGDIIQVPDVNMYSLVLLSHAAGHFFIPGIGYRFLCDWATFLKHNHKKIDRELVFREIEGMGMSRFVTIFTKLAEIQLGLKFDGLDQWTQGANTKYLLKFSERLFEHGDFGAVKFRNHFNKDTFKYKWNAAKNLIACRYFWPKFFWRRIPLYLFIFGLISVMRRLHLPVNYGWLNIH